MSKKLIRSKALATMTAGYSRILADIKRRIRTAQVRTSMAANACLLKLYWEIGAVLAQQQEKEGWGAAVLRRLAIDLHNDLPEVKGFSERNLKLMTQFFRAYPQFSEIGQPPVAQLDHSESRLAKGQPAVALLPWAHNVILMQKVKDIPTRAWYAQQALDHGWSRNILALQIDSQAHLRNGKAVTNFQLTLPPAQSDLASQLLKDPYIFDFLTLEKPFHERELETGLLRHLQQFFIELGAGFAFVGRQVHMSVGDDGFYIDLLFYHLRLRSFVVIDLKIGPFKPEYAGKMNFYLNAVDDRLRHSSDQPSIGLILCEDKNRIIAEYALRGMDKAIGVSAYQLTRSLPKKLQSALPSIKQLEEELSASIASRKIDLKKRRRS